jgi:hypothetical protein
MMLNGEPKPGQSFMQIQLPKCAIGLPIVAGTESFTDVSLFCVGQLLVPALQETSNLFPIRSTDAVQELMKEFIVRCWRWVAPRNIIEEMHLYLLHLKIVGRFKRR